jgi:hypothetical protein
VARSAGEPQYLQYSDSASGLPTEVALAVLIRQVHSWSHARRGRWLEFVMRNLLAVAFAALTSIAAASAQTPTIPNSDSASSAFGPDPMIRITTTFRARIEGSVDPRDVPSATAQDAARRTLYNMAANECSMLSEFWKAECRLSSFSVYVPIVRPDVPQAPSMFGTALYELRPTSAGR